MQEDEPAGPGRACGLARSHAVDRGRGRAPRLGRPRDHLGREQRTQNADDGVRSNQTRCERVAKKGIALGRSLAREPQTGRRAAARAVGRPSAHVAGAQSTVHSPPAITASTSSTLRGREASTSHPSFVTSTSSSSLTPPMPCTVGQRRVGWASCVGRGGGWRAGPLDPQQARLDSPPDCMDTPHSPHHVAPDLVRDEEAAQGPAGQRRLQ